MVPVPYSLNKDQQDPAFQNNADADLAPDCSMTKNQINLQMKKTLNYFNKK